MGHKSLPLELDHGFILSEEFSLLVKPLSIIYMPFSKFYLWITENQISEVTLQIRILFLGLSQRNPIILTYKITLLALVK